MSNLRKKFFKRLAWWASGLLSPLTIFKWTGILPYRTISYKNFSPILFHPEAQGVMDQQKPQSIQHNQIWTITPPSDLVMSHMVTINGGIADGLGNVFDPQTGKIISGATHKYRYKVKRTHIPPPRRIYPHVECLSGEVAVFTASNQHIYWHWLLDVIPRLLMFEEMGKQAQAVYLQMKLPFQREMLEYMGVFSKLRIIDCDKSPMISATTLFVPCHQIMEGRTFPEWVCRSIRKRFFPYSNPGQVASSDRVFISRAGAHHRRISNEDQLLPLLRSFGFQVVRLEELTFKEQMGLFRHANVVVAPNGSGLANLVFCAEGTTVIEIFPHTKHSLNSIDFAFNFDYNYRLARALGLHYSFVCGSSETPKSSQLGDYSLMPDHLMQTFVLAKIG